MPLLNPFIPLINPTILHDAILSPKYNLFILFKSNFESSNF
jgi:hypothetical protein